MSETSARTDSRLAALCAEAARDAFVEYERHFDDITRRARDRFLNRDWRGSFRCVGALFNPATDFVEIGRRELRTAQRHLTGLDTLVEQAFLRRPRRDSWPGDPTVQQSGACPHIQLCGGLGAGVALDAALLEQR